MLVLMEKLLEMPEQVEVLAVCGTNKDLLASARAVAEKNPRPVVARFSFGPRAGRAGVATRIRLAGSQRVVAIAEMSDGSFWTDLAEVTVTLAACIEDA